MNSTEFSTLLGLVFSTDLWLDNDMSSTAATATAQPDTICACGNGPFFYVPARQHPELCLDCAEHADRLANGWTPENSTD